MNSANGYLARVLATLPLKKLSSKQTLLLAFVIVALFLPLTAFFFKINWQHIVLGGLFYFFVWIMSLGLR